MKNSFDNLSPLDGRYSRHTSELSNYFSEAALIRVRFEIEIDWLLFVLTDSFFNTPKLSNTSKKKILQFKASFSSKSVNEIKKIESITNHDVKAVEYYIKKYLKKDSKLKKYIPYIHLGLTSEDINSLSYAMMINNGKNVVAIKLKELKSQLRKLATQNKNLAFLARTHGQPASPSTLGKEFYIFFNRLEEAIKALEQNTPTYAKWGGATGNYHTFVVINNKSNPIKMVKRFFSNYKKVNLSIHSSQIQDHDYISNLCHVLVRINNIIQDLNQDMWLYISNDIFKLKLSKDEVGSSTMPHKVNPIDFENSEGNLGLSNALLLFIADKLPKSRLQRDLSDSTVLRNIGVAFGYALLAHIACLKGLTKIQPNRIVINEELDKNWAVLAEPVQTILRLEGNDDAYEIIKKLTRGQPINKEFYFNLIDKLKLTEENRSYLKNLTPKKYIGIADQLTKKF